MLDISKAFSLAGKRAAVTGASKGIGQAIAMALLSAGSDVIAVARTDSDELKKTADWFGREYRHETCDFADPVQVAALAPKLQGVDILVNNAGIIHRTPAAEHADSDWERVLQVNLNAAFVLSREVGREMIARGHGKIIFTASLLSFQGGITVPGYAASKHAIAGLTKALANEWAGRGVQVNAIAPGYIETDNTQALRADPDRARSILERIPAGRWGSPDDIAGAAVFLASSASDYVNGHVLVVDGGWLAR